MALGTHSLAVRLALFVLLLAAAGIADARKDKKPPTIKSLRGQTVEVRPGGVIQQSNDLARDNYREFLDLVSEDDYLRAEAMRRLGDLELEANEAAQLAQNIETIDGSYDGAVDLYQQLLEAYPDYRRNDTVLYQLARGYEISGEIDAALETLTELVKRYPDTPLIDEVQFRRGEMLFVRKRYNDAEAAYSAVRDYGDESRFYEQSLYKLGWSQFKLAWHEDSLGVFFELLDRKIGDVDIGDGDDRLESLARAERELVEDTFRVLSISFSYMQGAESIDAYMQTLDVRPEYAHVIYLNLGDLYLEKGRHIDAAGAYEAFVDRDPMHPKAPLLQVEVIEAYKQGGFPSLVLDGKKAFVDRYGMDGEFWVRNPREENTAVAGHLKTNLTDLAQYYHAEAQANGELGDYQEAARWYRKYLTFFPEDPDSANTNFLLAEILFESRDYAAATTEYERTAYAYPLHPKSAEAGYAALLAYREHEATLEPDDRIEWHQAYLDSGLRFADTYPEHPESGAVLTTVAEELFAQNQFDLAIAVAEIVVAKQPPVDPALARTAWTVIAHSQFDSEQFASAEGSYYRLRSFVPAQETDAQAEISDRIASSIYKQGEQARDSGDLETAVAHFTRLGQAVPDSGIRATAEYDAAAALISLAAWDRASVVLERFRRDYPDSEFADDINQKLAVTYLESGRGAQAAQEFERIAAAASSAPDVRREALWKASELYEQSASAGDEERVLRTIVTRYPDPIAESMEARVRLLELAEARGDGRERLALLQDIVDADRTAGEQRSDRTRFLAANASLELAEPVRRRFEAAKLTQPLADSMKQKRSLMQDVIDAYTGAADYRVAEVTTAATFRLAEVYERFSSDLMASERPPDLDELALEQYELLLEEQVFPFEEKAIDLYKANTDRAADGVYDEWVERSFLRLAGLMPARYAKTERSEDVVTALY